MREVSVNKIELIQQLQQIESELGHVIKTTSEILNNNPNETDNSIESEKDADIRDRMWDPKDQKQYHQDLDALCNALRSLHRTIRTFITNQS